MKTLHAMHRRSIETVSYRKCITKPLQEDSAYFKCQLTISMLEILDQLFCGLWQVSGSGPTSYKQVYKS